MFRTKTLDAKIQVGSESHEIYTPWTEQRVKTPENQWDSAYFQGRFT